MCTDSKSLFDLHIGIISPTEKRQLINIKDLSEAYEVREVDEVV